MLTFDEQITSDITQFVCLRNLKKIINERQSKFMRTIKSSTIIQMQIAYD